MLLCWCGCLLPSKAFLGTAQCILQWEEAAGTRGAPQHLLRRSKAASEHLHCTVGTGCPQRTLPEGAGNHERCSTAGKILVLHPRCFYRWENKDNLKIQEIYHYLSVSSSWSLRGDMGRDVLLCKATLGVQVLRTIIFGI